MIYNNIFDLIGKTPILKFAETENYNVFGKLECFNPAGSVKDRPALFMINKLKNENLINKDTVIVEPTSGNTGIGIAMICSVLNIKCVFTMPETMSIERRKLLTAYGGNIILTDGKLGMAGAIEKARELSEQDDYIMLSQFENKLNPTAHEKTTSLEIIEDFKDIGLDVFVATIGTGGTITGNAKILKDFFPNIHIVGVEPESSPFLTKGIKAPHSIQGIGAGFKPDILDLEYVDEIVTVKDEDAFEYARKSGKENGMLLGISGGAAYKIAMDFAKSKGKNVLFIAPDNGERYLSTKLYEV